MNNNMKKIFLSHSSIDREIMDIVKSTQNEIFAGYLEPINTYKAGAVAGEEWSNHVRDLLNESDYMIAFITDAYLRSLVCISEFSIFWNKESIRINSQLNKGDKIRRLIPIVYNNELGRDAVFKLTGTEPIYIDANSPDAFEQLKRTLSENPYKIPVKQIEMINDWLKAKPGNPDFYNATNLDSELYTSKPYIGSDKVYRNIFKPCNANGIMRIKSSNIDREELQNMLLDKDDIYILGTTNKGIIDNNVELFSELLSKGKNIYVLIADSRGIKGDSYLMDVAKIEAINKMGYNMIDEKSSEKMEYDNWKNSSLSEKKRLIAEIEGVEINLYRILNNARKLIKKRKSEVKCGNLLLGNTFTLVRQTIILGVKKNKNIPIKAWCWLTLTLPPKRASETFSFEIEDDLVKLDLKNNKIINNDRLITSIFDHVTNVVEVSIKQGQLYNLSMMKHSSYQVKRVKEHIIDTDKKQWEHLYCLAQKNTKEKQNLNFDTDLIEIAAQHPLKNGNEPNEDFKMRLNYGIKKYNELKKAGRKVKIFVPGSIHKGDEISLSAAGAKYLKENDVNPNDIFGDYFIELYKQNLGVYNSADECYVASEIYKNGKFRDLYSICSANQVARRKLFYYYFGVIPLMYCLPDDSFHSDIEEYFNVLPIILHNDHDWQAADSKQAVRTRIERMPGYIDPSIF